MAEQQSSNICNSHKCAIEFRCTTCNKWVCVRCVALPHRNCTTLPIEEAIPAIQNENEIKYRECIETCPAAEDSSLFLIHLYSDILKEKKEELEKIKAEIDLVERKSGRILFMQQSLNSKKEELKRQLELSNTASSSPNALDEAGNKLNELSKDINNFAENLKSHKTHELQQHEQLERKKHAIGSKENLKNFITANGKVLIAGNDVRYGELDVKEGEFRIINMQQESSVLSSLCLTIDQCLTTITRGEKSPRKFFLQISSNGVQMGEVLIRLNENARLTAKTVLQLCLISGKRRSFNGIIMDSYYNREDSIWSSFCLLAPSGVDCEALLKEKQNKKWKKEEMSLNVLRENGKLKLKFMTCIKENNQEWESIPMGEVEKGFEVVIDAHQLLSEKKEKAEIVNCGWVLG